MTLFLRRMKNIRPGSLPKIEGSFTLAHEFYVACLFLIGRIPTWAVENAILGVSLIAILYPVAELAWSFISEVRAKRLLVTDQDGEVLAEFSTNACSKLT